MIDKFETGMIVTADLGDKWIIGKVTDVPEHDPTMGFVFPQDVWINTWQVVKVAEKG